MCDLNAYKMWDWTAVWIYKLIVILRLKNLKTKDYGCYSACWLVFIRCLKDFYWVRWTQIEAAWLYVNIRNVAKDVIVPCWICSYFIFCCSITFVMKRVGNLGDHRLINLLNDIYGLYKSIYKFISNLHVIYVLWSAIVPNGKQATRHDYSLKMCLLSGRGIH